VDLGDAQYQLLAELRYRIRSFLAFSERQARAAGLEPQQHQLLLAVRGAAGGAGAGLGELAERLMLRHHSAVELVDRLERRGLVARSRNAADRRRVTVRLSGRGERLLSRLSHLHLGELRSSGPELSRALARILSPESMEKTRERSSQESRRGRPGGGRGAGPGRPRKPG